MVRDLDSVRPLRGDRRCSRSVSGEEEEDVGEEDIEVGGDSGEGDLGARDERLIGGVIDRG